MNSITKSYFKGSALAIAIFDVTKKATFDNVEKWVEMIRSHLSHDIKIFLVGNKADQELLYFYWFDTVL